MEPFGEHRLVHLDFKGAPLKVDYLEKYVLKHEAWRELREVDLYPSSLCPSHPASLGVVTTILDQVVARTPHRSGYLHIGADEVWHMRRCRLCSNQDKGNLFLTHLLAVLSHLNSRHPHLRCIMWDDMLRDIPDDAIKESGIGSKVELMVWHYNPAETFNLPDELWAKYGRLFGPLWVASAYKGATGSCQLLPVIKHHISNHERWLAQRAKLASIRGIALTGWARPQAVSQQLSFPGWQLAIGVEWLANLRVKHHSTVNSDTVATWLNPWQLSHDFTNPMQIESLVTAFTNLTEEWEQLEQYMTCELRAVYCEAAAQEWIGTLVAPLRRQLGELLVQAKQQVARQLR